MKKHKLLWFYIFTVVFTVILGGAFAALLNPEEPVQYAISLAGAQLSPLCGLLLVCVFCKDFASFKDINWNISPTRKPIWLLLSVFIPVVIVCGSALILSALGEPYGSSAFGSVVPFIIVTIASVIGCIGEEVGWRGFMLPAFHKKHSLFLSSVFTGLLWGAWHFGKIALSGIIGYLLFIVMVTEWAVLMAWIFYNSGKSLLPMIIFHFAINICSIIMMNEREGISFYIVGCILGGILCLIVILTNKSKFLSKAGN